MTHTTLDFYDVAAGEFDRRIRAVDPGQWGDSTPCSEWDVRALVNHVVNEMLWVPPLIEGATIAEVGDRFDGDVLGSDPVASWTSAAQAASAALHADGALERTVHLSFGDTPADEYVWQLIPDLTVHAWDLARGVGANDALDERLVAVVGDRLEQAKPMLAESGVFGRPVDVGVDADPQTRMLAAVGRTA